ncbi:TIGR04282 family arsenosugar biosynthesis glycosyltransferase [Methylomonas rapida]|uniref:TIGR04282 family arsenosugar biosynthesis glycosyltransferase n=1 Tax=Methylomonas rapida TaxID=2963939 RepID=A0ABY7GPS4_9GAMM|nr:TIGR04282 family arsenosugar biosynthesis glycosyltransferase [Methylomonas rapida]WAR46500.1 TIGR04282 family arsenosugar biosynthesis glycosyltransferase [Methylomonas rapida]
MNYLFPDSVLLIFCKAPVPGQVKTRLQPALSAEQAVAAHRQLTRLTLARAFAEPLCPVQLYCTPDNEHPFFRQCAKDYPLTLMTQRGHDLGQRMSNAFTKALAVHRHAILIGCDCPSLTVSELSLAFTALRDSCDAVFGPAEDGGYVLLGLNEPEAMLFENISWGSERVMAQTRDSAAKAGLEVFELPTQWDVDDMDGWRRFCFTQGQHPSV